MFQSIDFQVLNSLFGVYIRVQNLYRVGTKYAYNFSFDRDHIGLQSRKFLQHLESDRLGSKNYLKKFEIAGIYGPYQN